MNGNKRRGAKVWKRAERAGYTAIAVMTISATVILILAGCGGDRRPQTEGAESAQTRAAGAQSAEEKAKAEALAKIPNSNWYAANTEADTFYIGTANELASFAKIVNEGVDQFSNKVVMLTADIDLSAYGKNYNDGKGWVPISGFIGTFDGTGKKIRNLYINDEARDAAGLFGNLDYGGVVENLGIVDLEIRGGVNIGSVVGIAWGDHGGSVRNCHSAGTISGSGSVGGIIGHTDYHVYNCSFVGTVSGHSNVGGIAGKISGGGAASGSVGSSFFSGTVSGNVNVGGIVGEANYSTSVSNSYSDGIVSGKDTVGGIVGKLYVSNVFGCYSVSAVSGDNGVGGIAGYFENHDEGCGVCITSNAALNPSVTGANVGCVVGIINVYGSNVEELANLSGNVALMEMTTNDGENFRNCGALSITAAKIRSDPTINGLFKDNDVWTTAPGKLPGLFGTAVDLPDHLK